MMDNVLIDVNNVMDMRIAMTVLMNTNVVCINILLFVLCRFTRSPVLYRPGSTNPGIHFVPYFPAYKLLLLLTAFPKVVKSASEMHQKCWWLGALSEAPAAEAHDAPLDSLIGKSAAGDLWPSAPQTFVSAVDPLTRPGFHPQKSGQPGFMDEDT